MKQYTSLNMKDNDIKSEDINLLVNDYIHLMQQHDQDEQFEEILKLLGTCDISSCVAFKRNYRNRNLKNNDNNKDCEENACRQIIDKIHCYYCHCFDVGHRLSIKEKLIINNEINFNKTHNILQTKWKKLNNNIHQPSKYNQLNIESENKNNTHETITQDNIYKLGCLFDYEESGYYIPVRPKYSSLKDEIINNEISILTIEQFSTEYQKAIKNFVSYYRKQKYPYFTIEYLLVLMIYCNYTKLQYEFSKTYREENGEKHSNFFWMGYLLKDVIDAYGTKIYEGTINSFYHGIGKKLLFLCSYGMRVDIYCPLSTSSAFEVAANFTNHNKGIVVEFVDFKRESRSSLKNDSCKYMSVSWVSDFAGEREHLFVQSAILLKINNLIDMKYSCDYDIIAKALQNVDRILQGNLKVSWDDYCIVSEQMKNIMSAIVLDRLKCESSNSVKLNMYAKEMCRLHFETKKCLRISIGVEFENMYILNYDMELFSKFYNFDKSINMIYFSIMYPNIEEMKMYVSNIDQCFTVVEAVVQGYKANNFSKLKEVSFELSRQNEENIIDQYSAICECLSRNVYLVADLHHIFLRLRLCDELEFIVYLICNMGCIYYAADNQILPTMMNLIADKYQAIKNVSYSDFHALCAQQKELDIRWDVIQKQLNPNLSIFSFFYTEEFTWINLESINNFFPHLKKLTIHDIDLQNFMVEDILHHLHESDTKLNEITFWGTPIDPYTGKFKELDVNALNTNYLDAFNAIGFTMDCQKFTLSFLFKGYCIL
eukprot:119028_1